MRVVLIFLLLTLTTSCFNTGAYTPPESAAFHVMVSTPSSEKNVENNSIVHSLLEEAREDITLLTGLTLDKPIPVYFVSEEYFHETLKAPDWSNAVTRGKKIFVCMEDGLFSPYSKKLKITLRHELLHAVLYQNGLHSLPLWFEEGLAVYMERLSYGNVSTVAFQEPDHHHAGSLDRFHLSGDVNAASFYSESHANFARLLKHWGPEGLSQFLRQVKQGQNAVALLGRAFKTQHLAANPARSA